MILGGRVHDRLEERQLSFQRQAQGVRHILTLSILRNLIGKIRMVVIYKIRKMKLELQRMFKGPQCTQAGRNNPSPVDTRKVAKNGRRSKGVTVTGNSASPSLPFPARPCFDWSGMEWWEQTYSEDVPAWCGLPRIVHAWCTSA